MAEPLTLFFALIFHQFLHGFFDIIRLRQDEIFELRGVADEGVDSADAADWGVEVFEKIVGDAGGNFGAVAV